MSFALSSRGDLVVLDQVNGRVQRRSPDGKVTSLAYTIHAPQDLALAPDGAVVLVDRLLDKRIEIVSADGRSAATLPLAAEGLKESGAVTGVFVDGRSVFVEAEHGALLPVGMTDGSTGEARALPGRLSRDGTLFLIAGIADRRAGKVWLNAIERSRERQRFTKTFALGAPVTQIHLLDSDRRGMIYLAMRLHEGEARVALLCVSQADGELRGRVELPENDTADETFREFAVTDDGDVIHAEMSEAGATYRKVRCPQ